MSNNSPRVFAVVTAAGQSRRMGGTDKLTLPLRGRPLLAHTLSQFLGWSKLAAVAVAVSPGRETELQQTLSEHCRDLSRLHLLAGGEQRQDSIRLALELLADRYSPRADEPVLIHDGARPFVTTELFEQLLGALTGWDGVLPATPVRDTVKRVQGEAVLGTEDRESLRMVQTPQAFPFGSILELHRRAAREAFYGTDDASLVERYGGRVTWIPGPAHNLKVTVPEDIALLSQLAERNSSGGPGGL
jgi:2-C-methyl-D-erythritol 4-phosphate cytidylyltransferase